MKENSIINYRFLENEEFPQWVNMCSRNFNGVPSKFFLQPIYDEINSIKNIIVAEKEGQIIGGIRIVFRTLKSQEQFYTIGGVTDINVSHGIDYFVVLDLLKFAFDALKGYGIDYVIGYTSLVAPRLYKKLQTYEIYREYMFYEIRSDDCNIKAEKFETRKIYKNDMRSIINFYEDHVKEKPCIINREEIYWEKVIMSKMRYSHVAIHDERICGYIVCDGFIRDSSNKWCWNIGECYYENPDIFWALIESMMNEFHLPRRFRIPQSIGQALGLNTTEKVINTELKLWCINNNFSFTEREAFVQEIRKLPKWNLDQF